MIESGEIIRYGLALVLIAGLLYQVALVIVIHWRIEGGRQ